jgi:hypothetical protein
MEAIFGTLLGIVSAIIGYFFREYKNKSKPFIKVYDITGGSTKTTDYVKINESIYNELRETFFIKYLLPKSSLGDITKTVKKCALVKAFWPELKKDIESMIAVSKEGEVIEKLSSLFNSEELKHWIFLLLITDNITIDKIDESLTDKIRFFKTDENNGEIWFAFPGHTVNFGNTLNNSAVFAKVKPFIDIIQKVDITSIKIFFKNVISYLDKEYNSAVSVIHELSELLEDESRWIFYVYIANLSKNPIILKNSNQIEIRDNKKSKYIEDTYLSRIVKYEGQEYIQDTKHPLVILPESSEKFCLITKKVQREMEYGKALREAFDKRNSKYRMLLNIEKVGLLRKQKIKSKFSVFESID